MLTVFRTHPLIHVSYLIALVPGIVLLANGAMSTTLLVIYGAVLAFAHSNTNLGFGPLGRIFVSPNFHRIHHQLDGPQDVNLGFALTIWDQLFELCGLSDRRDDPGRHGPARSSADRRASWTAPSSPLGLRRSAYWPVPPDERCHRSTACSGFCRRTGGRPVVTAAQPTLGQRGRGWLAVVVRSRDGASSRRSRSRRRPHRPGVDLHLLRRREALRLVPRARSGFTRRRCSSPIPLISIQAVSSPSSAASPSSAGDRGWARPRSAPCRAGACSATW